MFLILEMMQAMVRPNAFVPPAARCVPRVREKMDPFVKEAETEIDGGGTEREWSRQRYQKNAPDEWQEDIRRDWHEREIEVPRIHMVRAVRLGHRQIERVVTNFLRPRVQRINVQQPFVQRPISQPSGCHRAVAPRPPASVYAQDHRGDEGCGQ